MSQKYTFVTITRVRISSDEHKFLTLHFFPFRWMICQSLIISYPHRDLTINRARDEIVGFLSSFTAPFTTSDAEINDFVKITHAKNSACPANGKILICAYAIVDLKA